LWRPGEELSVSLDITVTEELRAEGLCREMVNRIQRLRKESGFEVQDRIHLRIHAPDERLAAALRTHGDAVAREVLALRWELADGHRDDWKPFEIDELQAWVFVERI
jgi:isoleucyl-tRNA synthetase